MPPSFSRAKAEAATVAVPVRMLTQLRVLLEETRAQQLAQPMHDEDGDSDEHDPSSSPWLPRGPVWATTADEGVKRVQQQQQAAATSTSPATVAAAANLAEGEEAGAISDEERRSSHASAGVAPPAGACEQETPSAPASVEEVVAEIEARRMPLVRRFNGGKSAADVRVRNVPRAAALEPFSLRVEQQPADLTAELEAFHSFLTVPFYGAQVRAWWWGCRARRRNKGRARSFSPLSLSVLKVWCATRASTLDAIRCSLQCTPPPQRAHTHTRPASYPLPPHRRSR